MSLTKPEHTLTGCEVGLRIGNKEIQELPELRSVSFESHQN